jgi:hypothetical protein
MLGDYYTRASLTPSWFFRRTDLLGNLFLITSLLDLLFVLSFLDHHTGHHACHDARILLYECILDALRIFSSLFRSIGSLLPIDRHSISLRSARLQTGRLLSWFVLFFWTDVHVIQPFDSSSTSSWPFYGRCAYTSLGGLWDMGTSRSAPTRLTAVPDKWVQPTGRPTDLIVGTTDLVGGPHDLLKTFRRLQTTLSRMTTRLGMQDKTSVDSDQADRRIWQVL